MRTSLLQSKIATSPDLDFGDIFTRSIDLFKKVWLQGFITIIISFLLLLLSYAVIYTPPIIAMGVVASDIFTQDPGILVVLGSVTTILLLVLAVSTISLGLLTAFFRTCKIKDLGVAEREDYFYYFKGAHLKKTILLGLCFSLISIIAILLLVLPFIYAMVPLSLIPVIYAFNREISVKEILKAAFKLGNKKWFITFGLIVVAHIVSMVGYLFCIVGILFTTYFIYVPLYFIYKDAIGFDEDDTSAQGVMTTAKEEGL